MLHGPATMQALDSSISDIAATAEDLKVGKAGTQAVDDLRENVLALQTGHEDSAEQLEELGRRALAAEEGIAEQQRQAKTLEDTANVLRESLQTKLEEHHISNVWVALEEAKATMGGLANAEQLTEATLRLEQLQVASADAMSRLDGLDAAVEATRCDVVVHHDCIKALEGHVEGLQTARKAADTQQAAADIRLVEIEASLGYTRTQMEGLTGSLADMKDALAETGGRETVDRLQADVAELGEQVKRFAAAEELLQLEGALAAVQGELSTAVDQLKAADTAAANEAAQASATLQAMQEEQRPVMAGIEQRICDLDGQLKALETQAAKAASSIQVHATAVSLVVKRKGVMRKQLMAHTSGCIVSTSGIYIHLEVEPWTLSGTVWKHSGSRQSQVLVWKYLEPQMFICVWNSCMHRTAFAATSSVFRSWAHASACVVLPAVVYACTFVLTATTMLLCR